MAKDPALSARPRREPSTTCYLWVVLADLWDRASATHPPLAWEVALALALVALLLTWTSPGYRLVRHLVTLVHEAGHALVAVLVGRRLLGVRLHADTSGLTITRGRAGGAGAVAVLLAGYPAPALVGLGGAALAGSGRAAAWLWGLVLVCALLVLLVRNLYGLLVVALTGAAVGAVSVLAPEAVLVGAAHLAAWTLLLAAPRSVVELQRGRRRARGASDADQLAGLTGVPAVLWVALFWLLCAACLVAGAWLLVRPG